ncbi:MAG: hypothetical protein RMK29_00210 [Myxococcales bacterium]|nr:hypothetical protein [Myxococcota bacterium]MDW8280098.1 hypothetical protein [Myxococcales bacterium]
MPLRDPLLLALLGGAAASLVVLLERRRRARQTVLDRWAAQQGMRCERAPPLSVLAPLEPMGLLPPVVAVERLVDGVLRAPPLVVSLTLAACLCGNRHRSRPFVLAVFAGPPELPTLRLMPETDDEGRDDLGLLPVPAEGLPPGYRAESFQDLPPQLLAALGAELRGARAVRVELRPGRMLLAAPADSVHEVDGLVHLGLRLLQASEWALRTPPPPAGTRLN